MTSSEILRKLYYDPSLPSSFGGVDRLHREAKIHGISRNEVLHFLKAQTTYTIHRDLKRKFKTNKIIVRDKSEQMQIDLADMITYESENDGFRYILTCIDCLTRYAYAIPLMRKQESHVLAALKKIFQQNKPQVVQFDKGGEFAGNVIKEYLMRMDIRHFVSQNDVLKAPMVERFNRTLKERMFRYFSITGKRRYIEKLDDLLLSYNNSYHTSIKMTPLQALTAETNNLLKNVYGTQKLWKLYNLDAFKLHRVGTTVRLQKQVTPFTKGYMPKWTEESFKVSEIIKRPHPMYRIKDKHNEQIVGDSYADELQEIIETPDTEFRIEKVISTRGTGAKKELLVKWLGYPDVYNSYVKEGELIHFSDHHDAR